ncbi:MAG: glycine cleavage T C-terminal barrel domain-containing protein, partial [Ilumatobacteraceae bacterium]
AERLAARDDIRWTLVHCEVDATDGDCRGNEPIRSADGRIIGLTTSGAYGHTVAKSLAFAYVEPAFAAPGSTFDVQLFGELHSATVLAEAPYDPDNSRLRS